MELRKIRDRHVLKSANSLITLKTSLLKFFNNIKQRVILNRRISVFLICVLIAALFWFLNALTKNYYTIISFPVAYQNLPQDKVLTRKLPKSISLSLYAEGYHLLYHKLKFNRDTIYIDVSNLNIYKTGKTYEARLPTTSKFDKIADQFSSEIKITRIIPDTIYFSFGNKKSKMIPVKVNAKVTFEKQYRMKDEIIYKPSAVLVEGLATLVDSIQVVETDSLIIDMLNKTMVKELKIKLPEQYESLSLSSDHVMAKVEVEQYTEATKEVPINIVNLPKDFSIKTFPEKVTITYLVAFSDFDNVTADHFKATVDYNKINTTNRLNVEISIAPDFVKVVKVVPSKVEYIIKKK